MLRRVVMIFAFTVVLHGRLNAGTNTSLPSSPLMSLSLLHLSSTSACLLLSNHPPPAHHGIPRTILLPKILCFRLCLRAASVPLLFQLEVSITCMIAYGLPDHNVIVSDHCHNNLLVTCLNYSLIFTGKTNPICIWYIHTASSLINFLPHLYMTHIRSIPQRLNYVNLL